MAFDGSTWPGGNPAAKVGAPGGGRPVWSPPKVIIPPSKPGYFGPRRTPQRIPFGKKKKAPVKVPFRIPGWVGPAVTIGGGLLNFFWPGQERDDFSWVPSNPSFQPCGVSCTPIGDPYLQGPIFGQNRNSAGTGCGAAACSLVNQGCPQGSGSYSGSGNLGRTLSNRPNNCVSIHEARPVMSGDVQVDVRCHVLQVWCAPDLGIGAPSYDPQGIYLVPERPAYIPHGDPAPFADFLPGTGQPFPKPLPFHVLPKLPDPDPEILPSPAPIVQPPPEWFVEPIPGVVLPMPQPYPVPTPQPGTPVPWPNPLPSLPSPWPWPGLPNPAPPPGLDPWVPPPYAIPAVGLGWELKTDTDIRMLPMDPFHLQVPPKLAEKERKFRMGPRMSMLWGVLGPITEIQDFIDVLYAAIPCQVKYDHGMMQKGVRWGPHRKAAFVAAHFDKMDATEFLRGYVKNQVEDKYYGIQGKATLELYSRMYESGINTHGGKPLKRQQIESKEKEIRDALGQPGDAPGLDQFNAGVDALLGKKPASHGCCAGRISKCAGRKFGENMNTARRTRLIFGRKAEQNWWIATKRASKYKRNAYSQARAGYNWQPRQLGTQTILVR